MIKSVFRLALDKIPRPWLIRISYWISPLLAWYYRGETFEDPIDGKTYRKLLPYGYGKLQRENALAPGSLSLERHRLLWLFLQEQTDFFDASHPKKLLHIAPEQCFLDRFKKLPHLEYTTGDLDSPIADIQMDLHAIPFDENIFDVVLCNHVLEHVQNDHQCMKEIFRVLKPGGWAIMQVPLSLKRAVTDEDASITDPEIRKERFGQYDHVRAYGRDYEDRLRAAGFMVDVRNYQKEVGPEKASRYALLQNEPLYICRKPAV